MRILPLRVSVPGPFEGPVTARRDLNQRFGGAWDAISTAVRGKREPWLRSTALARLTGSQLFGQALTLVRLAAEQQKPNEQRLPEYTESALPATMQASGRI